MASNRDIHHRRSIRLRGYDYSQPGAYFVTACTWQREHLFGEVIDGEMVLNEPGEIVAAEWLQTAVKRPSIILGEFVVMPNHFHAILMIGTAEVDLRPEPGTNPVGARLIPPGTERGTNTVWASCGRPPEDWHVFDKGDRFDKGDWFDMGDRRSPLRGPKPASVSSVMSGFKSTVTRRINEHLNTKDLPIWQRNYWERIIRSEDEYRALCAYIRENPAQWALDSLYSDR